ncbi:hypothetical protein [Streptomyces sp. enrichment culture]|uniref:hypothetical protein n=1 Tax=Streptomyces sp. enrichment culture TaxID=1795815 RepID=UPI003F57014E
MKRPRADEWAVIGEQADPVPGDPEEVARLGRELRRTPVRLRIVAPRGVVSHRSRAGSRERSIDALVDRRFGGADNVPHLKRRLREELLAQAGAAYDQDDIELYLSMQRAGA